MKRFTKTLGVSILSMGLLAACSETEVEVKDQDAKQTSEKSEKKEAKIGSRSNPVLLNKTATISDEIYNDDSDAFAIKFDLTVLETKRGDAAYQEVKKMNEFNEEAPEGYEWILTKAKVKFLESETEDVPFTIDGITNFDFVSVDSGDIYSGDIVGTTAPEFSFEMYVGNEKEGYIAGLVKKGEKAQLRYEEMLGGEAFFNLQ